MPLRYIRSKVQKVSANDALQIGITTASIIQDLADIAHFPPARALVSIILLIFETIQSVQSNKIGCQRLARRAGRILLDIKDQMAGRWDSAPEHLLKNLQRFEETLKTIYHYMKAEAECQSWTDRLLRKASIEDALGEYNSLLDEAAQSFQIATLINIHHAVGSQPAETQSSRTIIGSLEGPPPPYPVNIQTTSEIKNQVPIPGVPAIDIVHIETPPPESIPPSGISGDDNMVAMKSENLIDHYLPQELSSNSLHEDHGFRRYHQSEIMLHGRSCLKDGWWSGGMEVQVNGQNALIKRYEGAKDQAARNWLRDVKILSHVYHPNLPQMVGISNEGAPTPFILLNNVQTRTPQALVLETARSSSLATCADLMLRFYRDLSDTTFYLQRQFGLSDEKAQDFIENTTFRVGPRNTLVLGLPVPKDGSWVSYRNYNLTHTLVRACLSMLPNRGRLYDRDDDVPPEVQRKINHLVTLAQGLLPCGSDPPALSAHLQELIEEASENSTALTLRKVRNLTLDANQHDHSWSERTIPPHKFFVGDLGYIPPGKGFESFVTLRNVMKEGTAQLELELKASADHWCWAQVPIRRQPLDAYALPGDISGWAVAVPPQTQIDIQVTHEARLVSVADAWRYLLNCGKTLADEFAVKPEDLILVTRVGTNQDFYIRDFSTQPFTHNQALPHQQPLRPQFPGFGQPIGRQHPVHDFPNKPAIPSIFYLFTSLDPEHKPYWSQTPVCVPKSVAHPSLPRNYTCKIGWIHGFLNYVQLHAEDFLD